MSAGLSAATAPSTTSANPAALSVGCRPFRLAINQDKSKSGSANRTPQLAWADLQPILKLIRRCGGELAIGTISARSNHGYIRVYAPEPPNPVPAPQFRGTPFDIARIRRQYDAEVTGFLAETQAREAQVDSAIVSVRPVILALLRTPNTAKHTDIWGAISRAAYFLGEPGVWHQRPRTVAIQISDAIDNVGAPTVPLPEGTELYLVNGSPSLGALARLRPVRFESITAATRAILGGPQ